LAAAATIKLRTGQLTAKLAKQAAPRMREFTEKHCTIAVPAREHFRRAAELAGEDALKLRAGDALHLAIAESLKAQAILCLDHAMIESAKLLGMQSRRFEFGMAQRHDRRFNPESPPPASSAPHHRHPKPPRSRGRGRSIARR
jgi:predicted nucleic acid-binding protein